MTNAVAISRTATHVTIAVGSTTQFAKRYIKYLAKKFLKKHQLRDFMRVVAHSKTGYQLRYFNIAGDNDEDDEDDE